MGAAARESRWRAREGAGYKRWREIRFRVLVPRNVLGWGASWLLSSLPVSTWCGLKQTGSRAPTEKWWLLEPPGRCLAPPPLPLTPRRPRRGKLKISMQEGIQFVFAQLPSGKKELANSSVCPLKIQKKRIGFLKKQEVVA